MCNLNSRIPKSHQPCENFQNETNCFNQLFSLASTSRHKSCISSKLKSFHTAQKDPERLRHCRQSFNLNPLTFCTSTYLCHSATPSSRFDHHKQTTNVLTNQAVQHPRMARSRNDPQIKLKQPDRSNPSEKTLLELAEQSGILNNARLQSPNTQANNAREVREGNEESDAGVSRFGEAILWSLTLAMGYFTLDVLVANQYAIAIEWRELLGRVGRAWPGMLFYFFSTIPVSSLFSNR